ncbi:DUF5798 family protein [Halocalculus aciditolerans]|uniref:Uncharacterized protein n=1 Tax=Halocalculus aciditolerans TaxID=1383812 RepID=A0A830F3Y1_9EURY|nr:DUF5798 family protein [Halocalculus aciditolerans]GGL60218.1 hypothetical protein GCM10009039_18090 [Halocalculus aciditolerans]
MGLGSTAKKIQTVADVAEKLYQRVNHLIERVQEMQETVQETNERVETLEAQADAQGAVLAALAEREGVDLESLGDDVDWEAVGWGPDGTETEDAIRDDDGESGEADVDGDANA